MAKTNQTTELAVIPEQEKLNELIKTSDIELTKAEAHVKAFHPSLAELGELSRPLADLDKENPTAGHALIARETRLKLVKVRTGAETVKDDRKKILLIEGNFIQAAYNLVKGACELTEAEYMAIEKHQERIESERKSKLSESRKVLLEPFEVDTTYLPLTEMADDVFNQLLADSKLLFETKIKIAQDAELARIEAEKAEAERLAEVQRVESERIEAQRVENERLRSQEIEQAKIRKIEVEKYEAAIQHQRKEQAIKDAATEAESNRLAKIAQDAKAESDKLAAELQAKKDAEELAHQKEKERIEAEESERKAADKAPDVDKLRKLYRDVQAFQIPEFTSKEGKKIGTEFQEGLNILLDTIKVSAEKLKS